MKAKIPNNIINSNDGIVELFKFEDIQEVLQEDLLKGITGILMSGIAIATVKAVSAHNTMALKSYMKKVCDLAINGHGKKWNEPSFKSITDDEKRNALMITFQMAKYAGIYDYNGSADMPNSGYQMPKVAGGSTENFGKLLQKKTKWFGLKTVSDPAKNISSIQPAKNEDPNAYFTDILEQYRNALRRVFGETEAKQITQLINSHRSGTNSAAEEYKRLVGYPYTDDSAFNKFINNPSNSKEDKDKAKNLRTDAGNFTGSTISKEVLIKKFNQILESRDSNEYVIFQDMNKALDNLIDSYDKNIKEAISNNRTILDKKLKKDGLIALWGKYMNILRTSKQQFIDEFNKSVEYTYLKDFLRGTMLEFFAGKAAEIAGEDPEPSSEEPTEDTPEETSDEKDDVVEETPETGFSVRYEYQDSRNDSNESYQYGHIVNSLFEALVTKEDEEFCNLIIESKDNSPLGKIITFIKSYPEDQIEQGQQEIAEAVDKFMSDKETANADDFDFDFEYAYFVTDTSESKDEKQFDLASEVVTEAIGFDEGAPTFVSQSYQMNEEGNLVKGTVGVPASWIYSGEPSAEEEENSLIAEEISTQDSEITYSVKNAKDNSANIVSGDSMVCFVFKDGYDRQSLDDEEFDKALNDEQDKWIATSYGFRKGFVCFDDYQFILNREEVPGAIGIFWIGLNKNDKILESNSLEIEVDDSQEQEILFGAKINGTDINSTLEDLKDSETNESYVINEELTTIQSADKFTIEALGNDVLKSVLFVFSNNKILTFNDLANAFNKKECIARVIKTVDEENGDFSKKASLTATPEQINNAKYVYVIPRKDDSIKINAQNTVYSKLLVAEIVQEEPKPNLPAIVPKAELTKSGEFRIDLRNTDLAKRNNIKMCIVVLSSDRSFMESLVQSDGKAFKANIDKIPYVSKDVFKVIDSSDNYSVILLNFGHDTTAIKGIKFNKGFVVFEKPGDEIFFRIYPVGVEDGHLVLYPELASQIGVYKYRSEDNTNQKQLGYKALPGKQQAQLPGNSQKQISDKSSMNKQVPAKQ